MPLFLCLIRIKDENHSVWCCGSRADWPGLFSLYIYFSCRPNYDTRRVRAINWTIFIGWMIGKCTRATIHLSHKMRKIYITVFRSVPLSISSRFECFGRLPMRTISVRQSSQVYFSNKIQIYAKQFIEWMLLVRNQSMSLTTAGWLAVMSNEERRK